MDTSVFISGQLIPIRMVSSPPLSLGGVRGGENRIVTPQSPQGDEGG